MTTSCDAIIRRELGAREAEATAAGLFTHGVTVGIGLVSLKSAGAAQGRPLGILKS
jgi:hypothetical protein